MRSLKWLRAAAFVLLLGTASCGGGGDDTTTGPRTDLNPEDQVPEVQVQFVDHKFRNASLSGENLDGDPIESLIFSASTSLDIAVTRIDRQSVVEALLAEASSGTQVRIVTEKAYYEDPAYRPFYDQLEDPTKNAGNIEVHTDGDSLPRQMHSRFIVIDHARVVTGSYNWESSTADDTFGDVVSILNTSIAAAFETQFNQMFVENRFGVDKRDDTLHTFLVGGGTGQVEVYFGPTDRPRDLIQTEINASRNVFFTVQQFNDIPLANTLLGFMGGGGNVIGYFNDFSDIGSGPENNVYFTFANYAVNPPAGSCVVNGLWIDDNADGAVDQSETTHWLPRVVSNSTDQFADFNTMNHKLMFADHGATGGDPAVVFSTANYSDLSFSLNDEVFIVMRGVPLMSKYWRGINFNAQLPPANLDEQDDAQEFDQVFAMYPYISASNFRPFPLAPTSIIFGDVANFRPEVTVQDQSQASDGSGLTFPVDLRFSIYGETYFGTPIGTKDDPLPLDYDFDRSTLTNADKEFFMVLPAGEFTIVVDTFTIDTSSQAAQFEQTTKDFVTGPGGVRKLSLRMGRPITETTNSGTQP